MNVSGGRLKKSDLDGGKARTPLFIYRSKPIVFFVCCLPFFVMVWHALSGNFGPNPVEQLLSDSGIWAVRFLLISLAVTPIRIITGRTEINRFRRMMGLFAFFYGSVHVAVYIVFEHQMNIGDMLEDFVLSPIVQVGLLTYGILLAMALTSTLYMMKRMGKAWKKLHNLVHIAGVLAILHFVLTIKADLTRPVFYLSLFLSLELVRGIYRRNRSLFRDTFFK